jgi:uncharacterized protein YxjI
MVLAGSTEPVLNQRCRLRERILIFDDVYWVENAQGQRLFQIDSRPLRTRATLIFRDAQGCEVYRMSEKLVRVRDSMRIYKGKEVVARVHNALFTPLYNRFRIELGDEELTTRGTILYHEYVIERNANVVARVSKHWFRDANAFGVEVRPGDDLLLLLAVTTIIDMMSHDGARIGR